MELTIVQINRYQKNRFALLPTEENINDPVFFSQVCHVFLKSHPASDKLLSPVEKSSDYEKKGATDILHICFQNFPEKISHFVLGVRDHLPPGYYIIDERSTVDSFLAEPQEGTLKTLVLALVKKK